MACSNVQESQEARLQRRRDRVLRDGYAEGSWEAHEESWTIACMDLCCGSASLIVKTSTFWLLTESKPRPLDDQSAACRRERGGVLLPVSCRSRLGRQVKDVKLPRHRNIRNLTVTACGPTDRCNTCRGLGGNHSGQGRARTIAWRTCDRSWNHEAGQPRRSDASGVSTRDRAVGQTSAETHRAGRTLGPHAGRWQ